MPGHPQNKTLDNRPLQPQSKLMKKLLWIFSLCGCLAFVAMPLALVPMGCSTTANRAAYQTVGATTVSLTTAVNIWNAYVALKHPPIAQQVAVKAAVDKTKAALVEVCDAGAIYSASLTSTNTTLQGQLAASFQAAVANAAILQSDTINLINTLGAKVQ